MPVAASLVVILDSDLQDPPEVIPELVARWRNGAEVVYAQRRRRPGETRFKLLTAAAFYRLIAHITAMDIPRDTGDFRLLDRRVVDTLVTMREHHRFIASVPSGAETQALQPWEERHGLEPASRVLLPVGATLFL